MGNIQKIAVEDDSSITAKSDHLSLLPAEDTLMAKALELSAKVYQVYCTSGFILSGVYPR